MPELVVDARYLEAIEQFRDVYGRAHQQVKQANAVALATCDKSGNPTVRMVLLKDYDQHGFTFYTNLDSRKAQLLTENPRAALCLYWEPIHEQVRIEGNVNRVSNEEADAYFATRPRGSQIGAWASLQSRKLKSRQELLDRVEECEARFEGTLVSRPPYWSGFRVVPDRIEFWHGRESRLHERVVYEQYDGAWRTLILYP